MGTLLLPFFIFFIYLHIFLINLRNILTDIKVSITYKTISDVNICTRNSADWGFEKGFLAQMSVLDPSKVVERVNSSRVVIKIPPLPEYMIMPGRIEQISAMSIPAVALSEEEDIMIGHHSVIIMARALSLHGSFFDFKPRCDESMREDQHFIVIDLEGDSWNANIGTDRILQLEFLHELLTSDKATSAEGYENAFLSQYVAAQKAGVIKISRKSDTRVEVHIPHFPSYALPTGGREKISFGRVAACSTFSNRRVKELDNTTSDASSISYIDRSVTISGNFYGNVIPQDRSTHQA